MGPYGTIWGHMGPYGDHMEPDGTIGDHMGQYGTIWSHMGPYGTYMGPILWIPLLWSAVQDPRNHWGQAQWGQGRGPRGCPR